MLPEYEEVRTYPELYEVARLGWAEGTSFQPRLKKCDIDGIRDDAPEKMKKQFWDWVTFMKECDANGLSP